MKKAYLFYNPFAGGGKILEDLEALEFVLDEECVFCDMTKPETYEQVLFEITPEDTLVLCGGDGTLHCFANLTAGLQRNNEVYYYPAGEHNDFALEFGRRYGNNPFCITKHLHALPRVITGNRIGCFLTGIVFLTTGKVRRTSNQKKRYNMPARSCATVDSKSYQYDKVRFMAVMYGKYCCGGMTPDPSRKRIDGDLSCVVIHGCSRLRGRWLLRRMRKGHKVKSRCLTIQRGNNISFSFDSPVCLLVDGEVHSGITTFTAEK